MGIEDNLLFIEPTKAPSPSPVIDELTRKLAAAFQQSVKAPGQYYGVHECVCGVVSAPCDRLLPSGHLTNTLCVHYIAFHRDEVPPTELEKVSQLDCGEVEPIADWLQGTEFRRKGGPLMFFGPETIAAYDDVGFDATSLYLELRLMSDFSSRRDYLKFLRMPRSVIKKLSQCVVADYGEGGMASWCREVLSPGNHQLFDDWRRRLLVEVCRDVTVDFESIKWAAGLRRQHYANDSTIVDVMSMNPTIVDVMRMMLRNDAFRALSVLGDMGPAAEPMIGEIMDALKIKETQYAAISALGEIGPAAQPSVPTLIEALDNADIRKPVVQALARIGPGARAAIPRLVDLLLEGIAVINRDVKDAIREIGEYDEHLVPRAAELLNHKASYVQRSGIQLLKCLGPLARPALPALNSALSGENVSAGTKEAIRQAMGTIGTDGT